MSLDNAVEDVESVSDLSVARPVTSRAQLALLPVEILRMILKFLCPHCDPLKFKQRSRWDSTVYMEFTKELRARRRGILSLLTTSRMFNEIALPYSVHEVRSKHALTKFFTYITEHPELARHVNQIRVRDHVEGRLEQQLGLTSLCNCLSRMQLDFVRLTLTSVATRNALDEWKIRDYMTKFLFLFLDNVKKWQISITDAFYDSGCPSLLRDLRDVFIARRDDAVNMPGLTRYNFVKAAVEELSFASVDPFSLGVTAEFIKLSPNMKMLVLERCYKVPTPIAIDRMMNLVSLCMMRCSIGSPDLRQLLRLTPNLRNFIYQADLERTWGLNWHQQIGVADIMLELENCVVGRHIQHLALDFSGCVRNLPRPLYELYQHSPPMLPRLRTFSIDSTSLGEEMGPDGERHDILTYVLPSCIESIGIIEADHMRRVFGCLEELALDPERTSACLRDLKCILCPDFREFRCRMDVRRGFAEQGIQVFIATYKPSLLRDPVIVRQIT